MVVNDQNRKIDFFSMMTEIEKNKFEISHSIDGIEKFRDLFGEFDNIMDLIR